VLAHEALASGRHERHSLGKEHPHGIAQGDRLLVDAAGRLHLLQRRSGQLDGRAQRQRRELLALGVLHRLGLFLGELAQAAQQILGVAAEHRKALAHAAYGTCGDVSAVQAVSQDVAVLEHSPTLHGPVSVTPADLARMRDQLLFDGPDAGRKLSRFWILLVLAAIIASAGIVADSTATVIGAMIVAPLMTPILGTVLSIVTGDGANLARSLLLVTSGALAVVALAFVIGLLVPNDVVAATSSQVAGRVHPRLIDLLAALATGAVGAFALVRSDVSDTLPGVAIAISLVPPLAVVGITLEAGASHEAAGALLLFLTNVGAILVSGLVVMALYRVMRVAGSGQGLNRRLPPAIVAVFVIAITLPLLASSRQIARDTRDATRVNTVANAWATRGGWRIDTTEPGLGAIVVRASGWLPAPSAAGLRRDLDHAGLGGVHVQLQLVPEKTVDLAPTTSAR
jgi:uncharacterized hydrophobic protein (TIGR00271 family)